MAKRRKNEDDPSQDNLDNQNDADNFGLPDLEYKPLDEREPAPVEEEIREDVVIETPQETQTYSYQETTTTPPPDEADHSTSYVAPEPEKSNAPLVIGLIIGLVILVAGALLYFYVYVPQAEQTRKEEAALLAKKKRDEEARLAREAEEAERKRREAADAAAIEAKPAIGTIETLSERTKRYYVVITSAVDGDLLMDHAKKLSAKGVSTKIIPPFGKWKFFRLTISDADTFADAQASADQAKAEYGDGVWVIKY